MGGRGRRGRYGEGEGEEEEGERKREREREGGREREVMGLATDKEGYSRKTCRSDKFLGQKQGGK